MSDTPFYFEPQPWMAHARCRGCNTDDFFPERGVNKANMAAVAICAGCTVRDQCLQYALDHNESGIWGGTTGKERRRIKRDQLRAERTVPEAFLVRIPRPFSPEWLMRQTPQPINHGTDGGYHVHRKRGEKPCEACTQAHTDYWRGRRNSEAS